MLAAVPVAWPAVGKQQQQYTAAAAASAGSA